MRTVREHIRVSTTSLASDNDTSGPTNLCISASGGAPVRVLLRKPSRLVATNLPTSLAPAPLDLKQATFFAVVDARAPTVVKPVGATADNTHTPWFNGVLARIQSQASGALQLFVRAPRAGSYKHATGTCFVAQMGNGKHAIVSCMHTIQDDGGLMLNNNVDVSNLEFFILRNRSSEEKSFDFFRELSLECGETLGVVFNSHFEPVFPITEALEARISRLKALKENADWPTSYRAECLDPKFSNTPYPNLDVMFFHLPNTLRAEVTSGAVHSFVLANVLPAKGSPFYALGYHYIGELFTKDVYAKSLRFEREPDASPYVIGRGRLSATIGDYSMVGNMATTRCSTTSGTSGSPQVGGDGKVYAINLASYFDFPKPDVPSPATASSSGGSASGSPSASAPPMKKRRTSVTSSLSLQTVDDSILSWDGPDHPEVCNQIISRNVNLCICLANPGFQALLAVAAINAK